MSAGQRFEFEFPIAVTVNANGLGMTIAAIAPSDFKDAFSHETIARNNQASAVSVSYSWADLDRYREPGSGRAPAGIILHTARVGSTLQVRLLRCVHGLAVYSEPPALNDLLMPPWVRKRSDLVAALRFIVDLIGRHAGTNFVLKLRSWNSLFVDSILEAFPDTRWVFGVRHPLEVGVSVQRRPPTWMRLRKRPDNPFLQYAKSQGHVDTEEDYLASMLAAFYASVAAADHSMGMLVDYQQLPSAVWKNVCPHFCLQATHQDLSQMQIASLYDAKCIVGQQRLFVPDSAQKRAEASLALRRAVDATALPALFRFREGFGGTILQSA